MRDPFADGTHLLCDALTCRVPDGNDDFETNEIGLPKGELGEPVHGRRRHSLPRGGRADPVAQIRDPVVWPELVESTPTEKAVRMIDHREVVFPLFVPRGRTVRYPGATLVE